jgi:site-specific DNA-methyltransferase (adenine-specific)
LLLHGDCLDLLPTLEAGSIDMVLCDLPYGTTACKWDSVIPFEPLWREYKRVCKPNAAIVLTAQSIFMAV